MTRLQSDGMGKTYLYRLNVPPSKDASDFYEFTRNFSNIPHSNGTCHSEDIPLIFKGSFVKRFKPNDDNYLASQRFLRTFIEFACNGNPNQFLMKNEICVWKPLEKHNIEAMTCLDMGRNIWKETKLPNFDKIRVWQVIYDKNHAHAKY